MKTKKTPPKKKASKPAKAAKASKPAGLKMSPFQDQLGIGSLVAVPGNSASPAWGIVVSVGRCYRTSPPGYQPRYSVAKFGDNGQPMVCPDSRCTSGCVICRHSGWYSDISLLSAADVQMLVEEHDYGPGVKFLVDPVWLKEHWARLRGSDLHPCDRKLGDTPFESDLQFRAKKPRLTLEQAQRLLKPGKTVTWWNARNLLQSHTGVIKLVYIRDSEVVIVWDDDSRITCPAGELSLP